MKVSIGVASLQGDVEEHLRATSEALARLGLEGQVVRLRLPEEVEAVDAVILPGGREHGYWQTLLIQQGARRLEEEN
jgi:5'-phosphate synthase pdxT subunit